MSCKKKLPLYYNVMHGVRMGKTKRKETREYSLTKGAVIRARCSKALKARVAKAEGATPFRESDFVRIALEEWFAKYPTTAAQMDAIKAARATEEIAA